MARQEIDIIGTIGYDFWSFDDTNTAKRIKAKLDSFDDDVDEIQVNVDSLGGDIAEGIAIHDLLAEHPAKVTMKLNGFIASAATVIVAAGDDIKMSANAFFLVHRAWTIAVANARELGYVKSDLEKIDETMAKVYAKRSGNNPSDHLQQMDENNGNGVWLTADEAKDQGYIDEIFEPTKALASIPNEIFEKMGIKKPEQKEETPSMFSSILRGLKKKYIGGVAAEADQPEEEEEEEEEVVNPDEADEADEVQQTEEERLEAMLESVAAKVAEPLLREIEALKAENQKINSRYTKTRSKAIVPKGSGDKKVDHFADLKTMLLSK